MSSCLSLSSLRATLFVQSSVQLQNLTSRTFVSDVWKSSEQFFETVPLRPSRQLRSSAVRRMRTSSSGQSDIHSNSGGQHLLNGETTRTNNSTNGIWKLNDAGRPTPTPRGTRTPRAGQLSSGRRGLTFCFGAYPKARKPSTCFSRWLRTSAPWPTLGSLTLSRNSGAKGGHVSRSPIRDRRSGIEKNNFRRCALPPPSPSPVGRPLVRGFARGARAMCASRGVVPLGALLGTRRNGKNG